MPSRRDAETHRCVRCRGHVWSCPPEDGSSIWKEHLSNIWAQCDTSFLLESVASAEASPSQATVDKTWGDRNCFHLSSLLRRARFFRPLRTEGPFRPGLEAWSKKAVQATSKPAKPPTQWIPKLGRREADNMSSRRCCNWLSRAGRSTRALFRTTKVWSCKDYCAEYAAICLRGTSIRLS